MKLNQEIIQLFDEYTHKPLTRVEFLSRLTKLIGGTAALTVVGLFIFGSYSGVGSSL